MKPLEVLIVSLVLAAFGSNSYAQPHHHLTKAATSIDLSGQRSDTIDILHYTINLNVTDFTTDTLRGNTIIRFAPKMNNIHTLSLDLEHFTIDSVVLGTSELGYTYNDTILILELPSTENEWDTNNVTVYYHGKPVIDPSGWGGFYFQSGYAYNLGVGFTVQPHNFGRAWYPCFDNFLTRATYLFNITCDSANHATCNGYLTKDTVIGALRTCTWNMPYRIASYHAGVDVAPYTYISDTYYGMDTLPILISALPADTHNVNKSFTHLKNAISIYQNVYGRYRWNRVGYSMVSFLDGAMEHPSNIAYPQYFADGSMAYEQFMAHELSHHWFGDLVTCASAEEMWLNEGFANYNQFLFLEYLYGDSTYHANVRTNHEDVLHYCAIADHGCWALSQMPQPYTYGNLNFWVSTTYRKGADVIYTLRNQMGDSAFFKGLQYYLSTHMYQPVNADTLMYSLQRSSGMNLAAFFNQWVYNPGFPHFSIDSTAVFPNGNKYEVTVYVRQKLTGSPSYFTNVPLEISFKSSVNNEYNQYITVSGQLSYFKFTLPFNPVFAGLNLNEKVSEAIAPDTLRLTKTGNYNMTNSRVELAVKLISDTAFLYFEHNYTQPDPLKTKVPHERISLNRYWKISGIRPSGFSATAKLYFDGRKCTAGDGTCYLDTGLTVVTRDSLILLYRPNTASDWHEFPAYTRTFTGPKTVMYGYMTLDSLPNGEYAFANGVSGVLGTTVLNNPSVHLKAYPNPTSGDVTVTFAAAVSGEYLTISDMDGKVIARKGLSQGQKLAIINMDSLNNGTYFISLWSSKTKLATITQLLDR